MDARNTQTTTRFLIVGQARLSGTTLLIDETADVLSLHTGAATIEFTQSRQSATAFRVNLRLIDGTARTIERAHVSLGASSLGATGTTARSVGRAPVLTSVSAGPSDTFSFDVLPGYLDRSGTVEDLEFTFVIIGDAQLGGEGGSSSDEGAGVWIEDRRWLAAIAPGPLVRTRVHVAADGTAESCELSDPGFAVEAFAERRPDDPRSGRARVRVVLGGLGRLERRVLVAALDASGREATDLAEPARLVPGSVEYNALTVEPGIDSEGRPLGFRLEVEGEGLDPRSEPSA